MNEELKRCPFCGAKYSSEKFTAGTVQLMRGEKYFWAICLNCGVRTGEYLGDEEARRAWNKRYNENDINRFEKNKERGRV